MRVKEPLKKMKKSIGLLSIVLIVGFAAFILYRLHLVEEMKPVKEGVAAFKNENYQKALEKLEPAAKSGNLVARSFVAQIYALGLGVEADNEAAAKWLSCDGIKFCVDGELEYSFAHVFTNQYDSYHDMSKAIFWMQISSSKGYEKADEWLAKNTNN